MFWKRHLLFLIEPKQALIQFLSHPMIWTQGRAQRRCEVWNYVWRKKERVREHVTQHMCCHTPPGLLLCVWLLLAGCVHSSTLLCERWTGTWRQRDSCTQSRQSWFNKHFRTFSGYIYSVALYLRRILRGGGGLFQLSWGKRQGSPPHRLPGPCI